MDALRIQRMGVPLGGQHPEEKALATADLVRDSRDLPGARTFPGGGGVSMREPDRSPLTRIAKPFDDPDYIFELKHDGFRALAYIPLSTHRGNGRKHVARVPCVDRECRANASPLQNVRSLLDPL
jgi:hypothetical protein